MKKSDFTGKSWLKKVIAMSLVTALVVVSPIGDKLSQVVSAKETKYVKDIVLSYGKTKEDAEKWLTKNGYTAVEGDLNKGTKVSGKDVNVVLMGYKTTTKQDEAVRDISVMEMTGGFKITDMDTILTKQAQRVNDSMEQITLLAEEYRVNYKAAVKAKAKGKQDNAQALKIHDVLNKIVEDDSKKGLGDLFLQNFSSDEKKSELKKIIIQANPEIVAVAENYLAAASGAEDETWIDKMVRLGKSKTLYERTKITMKTAKRAKTYLDETYGSTIDEIVSGWESMQERLKDCKKDTENIVKNSDDNEVNPENVDEYFKADDDGIKELPEDADLSDKKEADDYYEKVNDNLKQIEKNNERNEYYETLSVMEYLSGIKYNGKTLYDFFTKDRDFESGNDRYEVCAIAEALSEGQQSGIGEITDIYNLIKSSMISDNSNWDSKVKTAMKKMDSSIKEINEVSIYEGINRDIFDGDVAVTSLADTREADIFSVNVAGIVISSLTLALGVAMTAVGSIFIIHGLKALNSSFGVIGGIAAKDGLGGMVAGKIAEKLANKLPQSPTMATLTQWSNQGGQVVRLENGMSASTAYQNCRTAALNITVAIGIAIAVIGIIVSAISIWQIVESAKAKLKGDYSVDIPEFMIDVLSDDDGEENYVYYEAAKCNRNDGDMNGVKQNHAGLKDFADINGDSGKFWVALYTTKDKTAGKPILADSLEVKYGDTPYDDDYVQLHNFNDRNTGINLTSETFNFADKEKGTYVRYQVYKDNDNTSANSSTASAFGNANSGIMFAIGILAGGLVGGILTYFIVRRKKRVNID